MQRNQEGVGECGPLENQAGQSHIFQLQCGVDTFRTDRGPIPGKYFMKYLFKVSKILFTVIIADHFQEVEAKELWFMRWCDD